LEELVVGWPMWSQASGTRLIVMCAWLGRKGWRRSRVTEVTKEARGLATVGRKGGLATAAMDGRSVATKVAMLAFMTEGQW